MRLEKRLRARARTRGQRAGERATPFGRRFLFSGPPRKWNGITFAAAAAAAARAATGV